ncbi:MAG: DUF1549 domain-containing protein, partial [Gemmataceae bacterium]
SREIDQLTRWIKDGAVDPRDGRSTKLSGPDGDDARKWWAFQPIRTPRIPGNSQGNPVDALLAATLPPNRKAFGPVADRRTLIRRATFDLLGLPPTPEEVDAFVNDSSPDAFSRLIDRLLQSPHYGERWGRHWLDVVRYADTAGDTADYPLPEAWRYRNYVIDSMSQDKPFDVFLREQIAGDILATQGSPERYAEQVTATGFLALSRRFGFDSENYQHLTIQDTIDTLGQSVMGLTLGCARCHDHKFDPVSMRDYYGLYGIFASTRYAFPGSEQKTRYRAMVPLVPPAQSRETWDQFLGQYASLGATPPAILRSLDDLDGDFEMQRFASGGSNGILVPPWLFEGKVSVQQGSQSPFRHVHPFGGVGVHISSGKDRYHVRQAIRPTLKQGKVHLNLEFRVAHGDGSATGYHRLLLGSLQEVPAVEVWLARDSLVFPGGKDHRKIPLPRPGEWHCLQIALDLEGRTFSGTIGVPGDIRSLPTLSIAESFRGEIELLRLDSVPGSSAPRPGLDLDNLAVQARPFASVSTAPRVSEIRGGSLASLKKELQSLAGMDGDLEAQSAGSPPRDPFHPGPQSQVKIAASSQSPFTDVYPPGKQGLLLPATPDGSYNGFGHHLAKPWHRDATNSLHLSFDFRCHKSDPNSNKGVWRFHLGHSHTTPALEFSLGATEFYHRVGNRQERVTTLTPGEWYQVRVALNLKARTFTA